MKFPAWKTILLTFLVIATVAIFSGIKTEHNFRATNITYFASPETEEDVESVIERQFLPTNNRTLPPHNESIWLKIPIPAAVREWEDGAVLFTGSNETVLSMQAYLVSGKKIKDLGYCDVRLEAPTCDLPTLQYAYKLKPVDVYDDTFLYLKILPGFAGIYNEFYFMEPGYFNRITILIVYGIGFGTGLGLLTVILAFIFFISLKEFSFLIYGLLSIDLMIAVSINRGLWDLYRPLEWFSAATAVLPSHYFVFVFDLLFLKFFFDISKTDKKINFAVNALVAIYFLAALLTFVHPLRVFLWQGFPYAVVIAQLFVAVILIYFIYKKRDWAVPFTVGWSMIILFTLIWTFYRNGTIDGPWYFGYIVILGRLLEVLILNVILYGKLKVLVTQIIKGRAKAEEGRIVKTLLRTLSHDLSSTTQVIQLGAGISMESNNKDEINKNLETILAATKAQSDIISQAKNNYLIKPDEVLSFKPVNINKCVNEIATLFSYRCKKKNIDLIVEVDEAEIFVSAEATCLTHQILGNLVSNALKFTTPGKKIFIKVKCLSDKVVQLSVEDEGIGMTPEMVAHLFHEGSLSRPGTQQEESTGHGLLIVRDFIKALGAKISVDSKVGIGTKMAIELRRC